MTTKRAAVPKVSGAMGEPKDVSLAEEHLDPLKKRRQKSLEEQALLQTEVDYQKGEEAKAIAARDIAVKEAEVEALEKSAKAERGLVEEYQQKIEKNPFPTYKPSQEDLTTYAQLGSMIATLGLMIGGAGKASSKIAIGAMTGMLNGWRQGRKDLWDREAKTFEKELQRMKLEHESIKKDLEMGLKLAATDKEASRARLMAARWKSGTGSVIDQHTKTGQLENALKFVQKQSEMLNGLEDKKLDLASKERAARDAAEQARLQLEATIEAARIRAGAKGGASGVSAGQIERMTQAMSQVSGAINSIAALPITTTGTIFGPSNFDSLFKVPLSALNNSLSSETAQMLRTRMVGVARNLSSLETGGAATGLVGLTQKIEQGIDIPAGTPIRVALDKLAEMRRIVEDSARAALKSNKYTDSQKELIRENVKIVQTAMPFTQQDVLDSYIASQGRSLKVPKKDKNISFTDYVNTYGIGKPKESLTPVSSTLVQQKQPQNEWKIEEVKK